MVRADPRCGKRLRRRWGMGVSQRPRFLATIGGQPGNKSAAKEDEENEPDTMSHSFSEEEVSKDNWKWMCLGLIAPVL
jgi:hypothetical protein